MTHLVKPRAGGFAAATAIVALATSASHAQLTPDRTYYGINRAIPMTASVPSGEEGELFIDLLAPGTAERLQTASAVAGPVDLAGLFPLLWTTQNPRTLYAQLRVAEKPIGPAVVLQPLLSPERATLDQQTRQVVFTRPQTVYAGLRAWVDQHVILSTTEGEIEFRMRPDHAPNTVWNFMHLVEGGFYTDIAFHRIVPTHPSGQPFVIQAGDPTGQGSGGPGYAIDLENSRLPHQFGVLSMAREGDPNTNGSQFFICLSRPATQHLDRAYAAFGEAVRGAEVIVAIERTPLEDAQAGRPRNPPKITSARLTPAPPYGTGPEPVKRPQPEPSQR